MLNYHFVFYGFSTDTVSDYLIGRFLWDMCRRIDHVRTKKVITGNNVLRLTKIPSNILCLPFLH
jgi:hypothetical protein